MDAVRGFLGRAFNRSKINRLSILLLTIISLLIIFGAYGLLPHPHVGTLWSYTSRLHQSFRNTTSQPWQLKKPIFNFGSPETNTSSSTLVEPTDEHRSSDDTKPPEKIDYASPSEYTMLDGIKVSPPAAPADTDNYLAICKYSDPPRKITTCDPLCLPPTSSNALIKRCYRPSCQRSPSRTS